MRDDGRLVPLECAFNVRDLGGYAAGQGTRVKQGLVYRAGDLNRLSSGDIKTLEKREIKTIIDFRADYEKAESPDSPIPSVERRVELPISPGNIMDLQKIQANLKGREIMEELNRVLVRHTVHEYSRFFKVLSDRQNAPVLFHCSAGKDRTGFGAAIFLAALGVQRELIVEDYMLSAVYLRGKYDSIIENDPVMAPMMTVKPEYIEAALDTVEAEFGGMETYLKETLGADTGLLRSIYTE